MHQGSYKSDELKKYLEILQSNLGELSFSLILSSNYHAVNLNYDAKRERWLLIDANQLPGQEYSDVGLLSDALLDAYKKKNGLVMETTLYTSSNNAEEIKKRASFMTQEQAWISLHNSAKINQVYQNEMTQLHHACYRGDLAEMEFLLSNGAEIADDLLDLAIEEGNNKVIAALIDHGAKLTKQNLGKACYLGNTDVINKFIEKGVEPTEDMIVLAFLGGQDDAVKLLSNKGFGNTNEYKLAKACVRNEINKINTLIDSGTKPTLDMFNIMREQGNYEVAQILAVKLIQDLVSELGIGNLLKKTGGKEDLIQLSIKYIVDQTKEEITQVESWRVIDKSWLKDSILNNVNSLAENKTSPLREFLQKRNNPRIDAMLNAILKSMGLSQIMPKKFNTFKKEYAQLVARGSIKTTTSDTVMEDTSQLESKQHNNR